MTLCQLKMWGEKFNQKEMNQLKYQLKYQEKDRAMDGSLFKSQYLYKTVYPNEERIISSSNKRTCFCSLEKSKQITNISLFGKAPNAIHVRF